MRALRVRALRVRALRVRALRGVVALVYLGKRWFTCLGAPVSM